MTFVKLEAMNAASPAEDGICLFAGYGESSRRLLFVGLSRCRLQLQRKYVLAVQ
jgi:hypothetical protein